MKAVIPAVLLGCGLMISCERKPFEDPLCFVRVAELEDSLNAYRDSLKDVQMAFSFNSIQAVARMQDHEIGLGDTCRAEVLIGAANTLDAVAQGYAYGDASLEVKGLSDKDITRTDTRWVVEFVPQRLGEDSLVGQIVVNPKRGHPERLYFSTLYKVLAK